MLKHKDFGTLVGSFGKGIAESCSINFGPSSGVDCDDSCALKYLVCYAWNTEKRKPRLTRNLEKKAGAFSEYLSALCEPRSLAYLASRAWIRFSAFGSIRNPATWSGEDRESLKILASNLDQNLVHFPVETLEKAVALRDVGFSRVRVSAAGDQEKLTEILRQGFHASTVVKCNKKITARNKQDRALLKPAFDAAARMRKAGVSAKVCPAVAGHAKCGACRLCANPAISVVIYPEHI